MVSPIHGRLVRAPPLPPAALLSIPMTQLAPIVQPAPASAVPLAPSDADRAALASLLAVVAGDPAARASLIGARDRAEFAARATALARAHGIPMTEDQVDALLNAARRRWLGRPR